MLKTIAFNELGRRIGESHPRAKLLDYEVEQVLALLKIARLRGNPRHDENWVDLAGYAACGAELVGCVYAEQP
jgi:hypothetical protein